LADCYWQTIRPLYSFQCEKEQKYNIPAPPEKDDTDNPSSGDGATTESGKEG